MLHILRTHAVLNMMVGLQESEPYRFDVSDPLQASYPIRTPGRADVADKEDESAFAAVNFPIPHTPRDEQDTIHSESAALLERMTQ